MNNKLNDTSETRSSYALTAFFYTTSNGSANGASKRFSRPSLKKALVGSSLKELLQVVDPLADECRAMQNRRLDLPVKPRSHYLGHIQRRGMVWNHSPLGSAHYSADESLRAREPLTDKLEGPEQCKLLSVCLAVRILMIYGCCLDLPNARLFFKSLRSIQRQW